MSRDKIVSHFVFPAMSKGGPGRQFAGSREEDFQSSSAADIDVFFVKLRSPPK